MDKNPVHSALKRQIPNFLSVGVFSAFINILMLTGSIYMLQIYDRVLSSRSVETLVALTVLAIAAFCLQGALDGFRVRILSRIGALIDDALSPLAFRAATLLPLRGASPAEAMQPVSDTDTLRSFLGGAGPTALFDMPFTPLFMAGCFLLHPWLGWFALVGGILLIALTFVTEQRTGEPSKSASASATRRGVYADAARRHAEVVDVLGMRSAVVKRWIGISESFRSNVLALSDIQSGLGAIARMVRVMLQSAVLGLGAYLAIQHEVSGGAMIAASILTSRALAPIETAIAHWKGFTGARQAYARLATTLGSLKEPVPMSLPAPNKVLALDGVTIAAPRQTNPIVADVTLSLSAGDGLAIIGPSGSGKSSLARAIVGLWQPVKGTVRLDGATLDQWDRDVIGRHIGYLPQELSLFDGTIAETISRFRDNVDPGSVIKAARAAGAHDMILGLPEGYSTRIGDGGAILSGGQRQRIGLARALFDDPFLVVLDEPNSNLDAEGDEALAQAIRQVRGRGGIAIIVTHRPAGLVAVDQIALIMDNRLKMHGSKDKVLGAIGRMAEEARSNRLPGEKTVAGAPENV